MSTATSTAAAVHLSKPGIRWEHMRDHSPAQAEMLCCMQSEQPSGVVMQNAAYDAAT